MSRSFTAFHDGTPTNCFLTLMLYIARFFFSQGDDLSGFLDERSSRDGYFWTAPRGDTTNLGYSGSREISKSGSRVYRGADGAMLVCT